MVLFAIWSFPAVGNGSSPPLEQRVLDLDTAFNLKSTSKQRYFNSFRGKPAITNFDWPFTPSRQLLQSFTTLTN